MTMVETADGALRPIARIGIVGTGVIGAGWAARLLARGLDVVAWDPAADAERDLRARIDNAWPALQRLGLDPAADRGRLTLTPSAEKLAEQVDFIQESAPERLELKTALHARLDGAAAADVVIASSTSGLLASDFQADAARPERIVIGHPFNPVYLLPLVEVVGGKRTAPAAIAHAIDFYRHIGMYPLHVRNEVPGFLSDRLQEALWRENLHMIAEGVATTAEMDDAITYGPGLRWAFMGVNRTFALAGGDGGMEHMLRQFGPALKLPWTKLKAPELTDDLIRRLVDGTTEQLDGTGIAEMERRRDDCLIAIMQALRTYREGAGRILQEDEERRLDAARTLPPWQPGAAVDAPLALHRMRALPEWLDYNGHMTESAYLLAFGYASDALFRYLGIDDAYRAAGRSFYTAESHINYLREVVSGQALRFTTRILGCDDKRLHLLHDMFDADSDSHLAASEQMLLHVDMNAGRATPMGDHLRRALAAIGDAHGGLAPSPHVGRLMAIPPPRDRG